MKAFLKILKWTGIVLLVLILMIVIKVFIDRKRQAEDQERMVKSDEDIHGGAFIAGDADTLDTQSERIARDWGAVVVTVNYTLARNGYDIAYGTEEIVDTVKYFRNHADEYGVNPDRGHGIFRRIHKLSDSSARSLSIGVPIWTER